MLCSKKILFVVAVLAVAVPLTSCKTTAPLVVEPTPAPSVKPGEAQDMSLLPFRQLVKYYAEWRREGVPIREALCRLPHLGRVYTIDDYHTAVRVLRNPISYSVDKQTEKEFMALGVAYGGRPYTLVRDSLTGKLVPFRRVEIRDRKDLKGIYWVNLSTPDKKNYGFLYRIGTGGLPRLKLEGGQMKIVQTITEPGGKGDWRILDILILEHPSRQPFVYKTPNLPPLTKIPNIAPGGKLENLPAFKNKTGFISGLKGFFNTNKAFVDEDKVEYVLAICHNAGGKARWVVSRPPKSEQQRKRNAVIISQFGLQAVSGALAEVSPLHGWVYATTNEGRYLGVPPDWYLGCDAVQPFVLKAAYGQTKDGKTWWYDKTLYPGRKIDEISFTALPIHSAGEMKQPRAFSVQAQGSLAGIEPLVLHMAFNTAKMKSPVVQLLGARRYESSYNGHDPSGCSLVSVTRILDTTFKKSIPALTTIFNFRVCGDQIRSLGETPPQAISKDLIRLLPEFSKRCQRYGETATRTLNYELYCRALKAESQCKVEISVMKDNLMLKKFMYDGCTGREIY